MAHILAVDDEPEALGTIERVLEKAGHTVSVASSGLEALDMISRQRPDLIVLDIIMPEMGGIEVCRRIRANPLIAKLPILFLTAKGRPADVVQGLNAGGDDYLVKPFHILELPARVQALLRRGLRGSLNPHAEYIAIRDLRLHTTRFEVQVDKQLIELRPIEHRLLHALMLNAGQIMSIEQLLEDVWEYPYGTGDPQLVRVHIANLRAKIELQADGPQYIHNVRRRGYLISK